MGVIPARNKFVHDFLSHKKLGSGVCKDSLLFHRLVKSIQRRYVQIFLRPETACRRFIAASFWFMTVFNAGEHRFPVLHTQIAEGFFAPAH